jgi:hypothetical protein
MKIGMMSFHVDFQWDFPTCFFIILAAKNEIKYTVCSLYHFLSKIFKLSCQT